MFTVSEELKEKLKKVNQSLRQQYPDHAFDKQKIRQKLEQFGEFRRIEKWDDQRIKEWLGNRPLVGVDGSVNSTKGTEMRTLSVFQALALSTHGEEKWAADVYTPLLEMEDEEEGLLAREARKRGAILSCLEMDVAMHAIKEWKPRLVMMDGALAHYHFDDADKCEQLLRIADESNTLLIGISEEISSRSLVKEAYPEYMAWNDRDLLYGILEVGEAFEWESWAPKRMPLWKIAFRPASSPIPITVDGLRSQADVRWDLLSIIYTLTPEQGRGIPFFLDIVDHKVRVTDGLVQMMVDCYIDPDLRHRLLAVKRSERII